MLLVLVVGVLLPYVPRLARADAALPEAVSRRAGPADPPAGRAHRRQRPDGRPPGRRGTEDQTNLSPQLAELNALAQDLRGDIELLRRGVAPLSESAVELAALVDQIGALQARLDALSADLVALQRGPRAAFLCELTACATSTARPALRPWWHA